jgi:structural maintenance of chromosome 1
MRQQEKDKLRQTEEELRRQRQSLEGDISNAASKHFAQLSRDMGAADIRLREREWRQERAEAQRHEDDLLQHEGSVKIELNLMNDALEEQKQRGMAGKLAELDKQIKDLKSEHQKLQTESATVDSEENGCSDRIAANKKATWNCEQAVCTCREAVKTAREKLVHSSKKLAQHEGDLQTLQEKHLDLLRQSVHDGIELPLLGQDRSLGDTALHELAALGHTPEAATRAAAISVNLRKLDDEKRRIAESGEKGLSDQKAEEERFQAELKRLTMELERQRPNLKAMEQLRLADEEMEKLDRDTAAAKDELEDVRERFEAVRQMRWDKFMDCFKKVNSEIDSIYKKLTMNTAGLSAATDGGSAFLDLEDLEDPFCGGVHFTAMPPAKRVSDLGQLSGGEKAMAALALLFAIHSYQRPPFLMLDEVDAHLDANNMHALASFMRSAECQTIVISLKEQLFTQCQGMVGVSKNRLKEASCIFTFDLDSMRGSGAALPGRGAAPAPNTPPQLSPAAQRVLVPMLDSPLSSPSRPSATSRPLAAAASPARGSPSPPPEPPGSGGAAAASSAGPEAVRHEAAHDDMDCDHDRVIDEVWEEVAEFAEMPEEPVVAEMHEDAGANPTTSGAERSGSPAPGSPGLPPPDATHPATDVAMQEEAAPAPAPEEVERMDVDS